MSHSRLFIIGNGFDLHFNIPTSYHNYKEYLIKNNLKTYKGFDEFRYFFDTSDKWSELEKGLNIDYDQFIYDAIYSYPIDLMSENHVGWHDFSIEIEIESDWVKSFIKDEFYKWISNVDADDYVISSFDIRFDINDKFVNFNYTKTLEKYFDIDKNRILYIHGNVNDKNSIQFGYYGINNSPSQIYEEMESQLKDAEFFNAVYEPGLKTMFEYLKIAYKNVEANSITLKSFIEKNKFDEIIVLGKTINEVDRKYFDLLFQSFPDAKWTFWCHTNLDQIEIKSWIDEKKMTQFNFKRW